MGTWHYVSIAGSWTRVARVKAEYPNQLDYNGLDEIKKAFVTAKKRYSITGELLNISNGKITPFWEYIYPLRLGKCSDIDSPDGNFNTN